MFYYISGTLVHKTEQFAVIDAGGVGYKIYSTAPSLNALGEIGSQEKMYTYLRVGEDFMDIYGFASLEELNIFEMLLGVSGVGGKGALSILSTVSPSKFALAIISGDVGTIKAAQGVGPKLAQRIILELKDKFKNIDLSDIGGDALASGADVVSGDESEAVEALMVLGYSPQEAKKALSGADGSLSVEDKIKYALKNLMR